MSDYWKNKRVWITGASSGIGEQLALQLAAKGADLVLSSRSGEKLEALRNQLQESKRHTVIVLDVADTASTNTVLKTHESILASCDVLINNAGISQRALTWEASSASERLVMETNFFGTVALTKFLLPHMMARKKGHIINMSSVVGKFGFPLRSSYAASKHALMGYFDSLRAELDASGIPITITMVCPGRIATAISLNAVLADGTKQAEMDPGLEAGISPEKCAREIIRAAGNGRAEIYIGKEQFLIYLKRFFPSVFRLIVARINPK